MPLKALYTNTNSLVIKDAELIVAVIFNSCLFGMFGVKARENFKLQNDTITDEVPVSVNS